jgi:hypothetical protein
VEARALAGAHGLGDAEFDAALAHFAAPSLSPAEAAMVRIARDTIRFRPIDLQRRARGLLDQLGASEFVEFVGITALANAVCRLFLVTRLGE